MGPVAPSRLGIVVGLPREAAILRRMLGDKAPPIFCSGARPDRVAAGVAKLLAGGVDALLSFGFAGGLAAEVRPGDMLIADAIVGTDGRTYRPDGDLSRDLGARLDHRGLVWRPAAIAGVDRIVASIDAKRRLAAVSQAVAVDMESHAMAAAAGERPFAILRIVLDAADRTIPAAVTGALSADGNVRPVPLLCGLLRRPGEIADLIALARCHRRAHAALAAAAAALGDGPAPA